VMAALEVALLLRSIRARQDPLPSSA